MEDGDGGPTANPSSKKNDTGNGDEVQPARCKNSNCRKENDEHMIQCKECDKYVHFACTRLPPSHLQRFMTKGYKRYVCDSCYGEKNEVHEDYINNCYDREWTARESELLNEIERLKRCADQAIEENISVKEELAAAIEENITAAEQLADARKGNEDLVTRIKSLEEGAKHNETVMRSQGKMITSLREKVAANSKEPNEALSTENGRLVAQVAEMKDELAAFRQSIQDYETNETALKNKVLESEATLKKQQKTFDEAGNPDYDNMMKLEEYMKRELVQMGKTLKDSLVKEIQNNNKMMEEKLMSRQAPAAPVNTKDVNDTTNQWKQAAPAVDFRAIMLETQNEQLNEANDQKVRAKNIIIHGVDEVANAEKATAKKNDEDFVKRFLSTVTTDNVKYKSVHRLGKPDPAKRRPIMLMLESEAEKDKVMMKLPNLKDKAEYKGVSITEDYTVTERKLIQDWRDKAKTKNEEEGPDSNYVWRVRGTPKNGLDLKRFPKQRTAPRAV